MLTPQQLTEAVETLYPALDELNQWITMDMVRRFMARLGRGEDAVLSGTDRWQTEVYQAAGGHLEDLKKQLQTFTKQTDAEIASIFEDAAVKAWAADCAVYAAAGREVKPLALSDRMVAILQDAYTRTQGEAHNFTRSTADASQKRLFKVLDESYFKVITGAQSYTAAVQEGVDELVKHQTRVIYPTGHTDTLETAVLRAVRTGVSQATGNMSLQSMIWTEKSGKVTYSTVRRFGDRSCRFVEFFIGKLAENEDPMDALEDQMDREEPPVAPAAAPFQSSATQTTMQDDFTVVDDFDDLPFPV